MTFSISREPFTPALLVELKPLILANHAATSSRAPLDPDWELLDAYGKGAAMVVVVCRHGDQPVGYCSQVMHRHQLYGELWASCVAIYLEPAFRRYFPDLLHHMEALAEGAGAACISFNLPAVRAAQPFVRLGYGMAEVVVTKRFPDH